MPSCGELRQIARRVERHYGCAQDIEWAIDAGRRGAAAAEPAGNGVVGERGASRRPRASGQSAASCHVDFRRHNGEPDGEATSPRSATAGRLELRRAAARNDWLKIHLRRGAGTRRAAPAGGSAAAVQPAPVAAVRGAVKPSPADPALVRGARAVARYFLSRAEAGRAAVRRGGRRGRARHHHRHHRGHETHEHGARRAQRQGAATSDARDGSWSNTARRCSSSKRGSPSEHPPRPDRQPRRDRRARHPHLPAARHRNRAGRVRGGSRSLPARLADRSVCIGPARPPISYLT